LMIKKYPQAINTYINMARVYYNMGKKNDTKTILFRALEMGNVENNRNLFHYIYGLLSEICASEGDYRNAYDYNIVAGNLMNQFFHDRIQMQINEMSAKYDLQAKEEKIREEEHKNKAYRMQKNYLILVALISTMLLLILVVLFRFKSRAYNKLVEQNLKTMNLEKQVENCRIQLSESEIMIHSGASDQPPELALMLEKFMVDEKPYLWSDVSLDEFCKKLNTNRTYLSKLIRDRYNMGFYDLLLKYRLRAAIEYLNNPQLKHLSIEGIGEMTGFKSNSNFHKRFKETVGMTPNEFRERALKIETRPAT
ncbi:MAG: helix-turn-helix transcriptional regulator, partial [Bacteroidales bacterium]|nr:helix-turn-helix transcriptional regulator [Bacteroidales bacterium]